MSQLLEEILSRDNMMRAYKQVVANKEASGVDGITTEEVKEYFIEHWKEICEQIRNRKYKPQPVHRADIPKPNSGVRNLGIPSVVDIIIEQAIAQKQTPIRRYKLPLTLFSQTMTKACKYTATLDFRRKQGAFIQL